MKQVGASHGVGKSNFFVNPVSLGTQVLAKKTSKLEQFETMTKPCDEFGKIWLPW